MKKVSIIVPIYNTQRDLSYCLETLVNQSLEDIEIILIDDASTDNSYQIASTYALKYPKLITLIRNNINVGQGLSRNLGMSIATGQYITFVDSDDFVHPDMYKVMYSNAVKNNYPGLIASSFCNANINDTLPKDRNLDVNVGCLHYPKCERMILSLSPAVWGKLFRRNTINNNQFVNSHYWEDFAFTAIQVMHSQRIYLSNDKGYFYRRDNPESVSSRGSKINPYILDVFKVTDKVEEIARKEGTFKQFEEEIRIFQASLCLRRITDILNWDIPANIKMSLCLELDNLICAKYGNWRYVDFIEVSLRCNMFVLESYGITGHQPKNSPIDELESGIQYQLGKLNK